MKEWSLVLLAVALLMPITAAAQHSSKAAEAKPGSKTPVVARKAVSIFGQISKDGKTLVSEENDIWSVTIRMSWQGMRGNWFRLSVR